MLRVFILCFLCFVQCAQAQYAPQAGISGSTAIGAASTQIVAWATHCTVHRGYIDIAQPSLGYVSSGDSSMATGAADNFVVSLGDSGVATLTFASPIINGPGYDFAVFENGFLNPLNTEEAFLELAFVEVSSDGINFYRFPSSSLTQDTQQLSSVAGENYMNARMLNNLAGKYISNYGTPFDLEELNGIAGLNVNHITHLRIVDVVGSINGNSSYDASNNIINDPYPTAFPTGGFDLDAVAVLHQLWASSTATSQRPFISIYPNPAHDFIVITASQEISVSLVDITGKVLKQQRGAGKINISLDAAGSGIYFLKIINDNGMQWAERIYKL